MKKQKLYSNAFIGDFLIAVRTDNLDNVKMCLNTNGYHVRQINEDLIFKVVPYASFDIIKYLIENGAEINDEEDYSRDSILTESAHYGNLNVVKYLIENGADKNYLKELMYIQAVNKAFHFERLNIVKYLIENGLDYNFINIVEKKELLTVLENNIENESSINKIQKYLHELYLKGNYNNAIISHKEVDLNITEIVNNDNSVYVPEGQLAFSQKESKKNILGTWNISECVGISFYNPNLGTVALVHFNWFNNGKKELLSIARELINYDDVLEINIATNPSYEYSHLFRRIKQVEDIFYYKKIKNIYYSSSLVINSENGEILKNVTNDDESIKYLFSIETKEEFCKWLIWKNDWKYNIEKEPVICFNGKKDIVNKENISKIYSEIDLSEPKNKGLITEAINYYNKIEKEGAKFLLEINENKIKWQLINSLENATDEIEEMQKYKNHIIPEKLLVKNNEILNNKFNKYSKFTENDNILKLLDDLTFVIPEKADDSLKYFKIST